MSCSRTTTRPQRFAAPGASATTVTEPVRIGDPERNEVQDVLGQALALGYLSIAEFQTRLDLVPGAATTLDLAAIIADLPAADLLASDPARKAARLAVARRGFRVHAAAYTAAAVLMLAIWLAVAVPTGAWFPWPIWPLLGGGIGILFHANGIRRTHQEHQ